MKFLLILVIASYVVVAKTEVTSDFPLPSVLSTLRGALNRPNRNAYSKVYRSRVYNDDEVAETTIEPIYDRIKEFALEIASILKPIEESLGESDYSNVAKLVTVIIQGLIEFSENVGTVPPETRTKGNALYSYPLKCVSPYDRRPECQRVG